MKKIFYLFLLLVSALSCGQSVSSAQALKSDDPKVIAKFVKDNPNDPNVPELKRKLIAIYNSKKSPAQKASTAKPEVKPLSKEKLKSDIKKDVKTTGKVSEDNKKRADLLTHMFSNDPNRKQAYVQIVNKSKCNLIVKISGKKFYNLTIPANNQNFILIDKGTYTLSSSICDAQYSATKNINTDISISLGGGKSK